MGAVVKRVALVDVLRAPEFPGLLAGYEREAAMEAMPAGAWRRDVYEHLAESGRMLSLGAYDGDRLVGFLGMIVTVLPQYGNEVAVIDSVYVDPASRSGGVGRQLMREAECWALEMRAAAILISGPVDGVMAKIAPRWGYQPATKTFLKVLVPERTVPCVYHDVSSGG